MGIGKICGDRVFGVVGGISVVDGVESEMKAKRFHSEQEQAAAYRKAWESGKKACRRGWARLGPYVGDMWLNWWFEAGFDGKSQDEAWAEFKKEHEVVIG